MEYLLTVAGAEWDGANWRRWREAEDQSLIVLLKSLGNSRDALALHSPTGLMLGDLGKMSVFLCRECRAWPTRSIMRD